MSQWYPIEKHVGRVDVDVHCARPHRGKTTAKDRLRGGAPYYRTAVPPRRCRAAGTFKQSFRLDVVEGASGLTGAIRGGWLASSGVKVGGRRHAWSAKGSTLASTHRPLSILIDTPYFRLAIGKRNPSGLAPVPTGCRKSLFGSVWENSH